MKNGWSRKIKQGFGEQDVYPSSGPGCFTFYFL
jgi:hypothetical protein